jgi:L-cystine transport system permease protein
MDSSSLNIPFLVDTFFVALSGVPITLLVTIVSLFIAIPLGFVLAISRIYEIPVINQIVKTYVSFVRGTPLIIQIFVLYSSIPLILTGIFEACQIHYNVYDIHPLWYGFIIFSFNTAAILVEVFRSALGSVDKGQI